MTILHYDHFNNATCRKLFLYIFFLVVVVCLFFVFFFVVVFYILPMQHVEMYFFFSIFLHLALFHTILWKNTISDNTLFEIFMKIIYFFHIFADSDTCNFTLTEWFELPFYSVLPDAHANPRNIWVGPPGGYRESLWNALLVCRRFQRSKVHLVHQVQMDLDDL